MIAEISSLMDNVSHVIILVIKLFNVLHTKPSLPEKQERKESRLGQRKIHITNFLLFKMKLNVLILITLVMKSLNAGANFSQKSIYLQPPKYGERRNYRLRTVA